MQTKSIPYTINRGGYYYFSRRVPSELIGHYSYPSVVQGLRTRSPSQAKNISLTKQFNRQKFFGADRKWGKQG